MTNDSKANLLSSSAYLRQNRTTFQVWGVRELIKQGEGLERMALRELRKIRSQGIWITRDVNDGLKLGDKGKRFIIEPGSRRIDKHRVELVFRQIQVC